MTEKIYAQIDNEKIELQGEELEKLLTLREEISILEAQQEQERLAKQANRSAALAKLEALGLDEDDLKALGL